MKPLAFHIENEQNFPGKGVGDSEEGVMTKFENAKMLINGQVVGTSVNGTISSNTSNPIFCSSLVAFELDGNNRVVYHPDKRMISDFTDGNEKKYGVLLIQFKDFFQKIEKRCKELNISWLGRSVIYTDDSLKRFGYENGYYIPPAFYKRKKYEYQKEVRVLLYEDVSDYYILDIGDISEISRLFSLSFFDYGIEIEVKQ